MAALIGEWTWCSSPKFNAKVDYEYQRSGSDVKYKFTVTLIMKETGWYNDAVGAQIYLNNASSYTTRGVVKSGTSGSIDYRSYSWTSDWQTVSNKTSGTVPFKIEICNGGGSMWRWQVESTKTADCAVPPAESTISNTVAGTTINGPTISITKYDSSFTDNITLTYNSKTITRNNFTSSTLSFSEEERLLIFKAQGASTTKSWTISGTTKSGNTTIGTFSGSVNITTEALAAVTSANNFNVGDSTSYKCSKGGAGSFSVYARVTNASGTVAGSATSQTTDGTKTMSFTASTIYSSNTSSQSGKIFWTVTSYIYGESIGTTSGVTCNYTFIKERCGPTLSTFQYAVTDAGTQTLMSTGSSYVNYDSTTIKGKFIQSKTTLGFKLTGSVQQSATVGSFYVKIPGQSDVTATNSSGTYVASSGVLQNSGTIYGYIKDSRKFEDYKQFTYTLNDYYLPSFIYSVVRNPMSSTNPDQDKYVKLTATITMPSYIITNLRGSSSYSIKVSYKATTASSWSSTSDLKGEFTYSGNTATISNYQLSPAFDENTQYDIKLVVVHYYGTTESTATIIPISAPLLSKRYQALGINKIPSSNKALDIRGSENIENGNLDVSGYVKAGAPIYSNTKQLQSYYRINLTSLSSSNFYPVTFTASNNILDCEIHSVGGGGDLPYNQNVIHFQLLAQGWSDTPQHFNILTYERYAGGDEITIGSIGYGTRGGYGRCVWLRGSLNYDFYCNFTPTLHTSNYTINNETYTVGTGYAGGTNTNVNLVFTPANGRPSLSSFSGLNRSIIDIIYPINSIYMSTSNTNPQTLFPGTTWTQLKDRFLLGAGDTYSNGSTGGYKALQAHTHSIPALSGSTSEVGDHSHYIPNRISPSGSSGTVIFESWPSGYGGERSHYTNGAGKHTHTVTTTANTSGSTGGGASSSASDGNMPPYLVVYMWKRTA